MPRILKKAKIRNTTIFFAVLIGLLISAVLIQELKKTKSASAWNGGDNTYVSANPSTHFALTQKAVNEMARIDSFFNDVDANNDEKIAWMISRYSDWPDKTAEKFSAIPQDCHFYHYPTKKNLAGSLEHTAKERFTFYYAEAKTYYLNNNFNDAKRSLGKAVHYIADLTTPVHTGYTGPVSGLIELNYHVDFENTAKSKQGTIIANTNVNYNYNNMHLLDIDVFAEQVAEFSYSHYGAITAYDSILSAVTSGVWIDPNLVLNLKNLYFNAIEICLTRSMDYIATVFYKFAQEVNMPQGNGAYTTVSGDFDGDGRDDIAKICSIGNNTVEINVWQSTVNGFICNQWWSSSPTSVWKAGAMSEMIISGDFDNDDMDEIAALYDCGNGAVEMYMWKFNGLSFDCLKVWDSRTTLTSWNANAMTGTVICGDFDNDARDEIAGIYDCGNGVIQINMWKFNGSGFNCRKAWDSKITLSNWDANAMRGMVVNREGSADEIAAFYDCGNGALEIYMWKYNETGFACYKRWSSSSTISDWHANNIRGMVVSGDFYNDGVDKIAAFYDCGNGNLEIYVWEYDGTSFTCYRRWSSSSTTSDWYAYNMRGTVVSGDFNNDGKDEIAAFYGFGNSALEIYVWEYNESSFTCYKRWSSFI